MPRGDLNRTERKMAAREYLVRLEVPVYGHDPVDAVKSFLAVIEGKPRLFFDVVSPDGDPVVVDLDLGGLDLG